MQLNTDDQYFVSPPQTERSCGRPARSPSRRGRSPGPRAHMTTDWMESPRIPVERCERQPQPPGFPCAGMYQQLLQIKAIATQVATTHMRPETQCC
jgi:hypothetical protein